MRLRLLQVNALHELLKHPFEDQGPEFEPWTRPIPKEMDRPGVNCLSCSS